MALSSTVDCSSEMQESLIQLHDQNKQQWRTHLSSMIREHPDTFSILRIGEQDDGDNLYTFDEFKSHFQDNLNNEKLLRLIYDDIDHTDDSHVKFTAIHRWMHSVKQRKATLIDKDHKWLYKQLQPIQPADLDRDGNGIDRQKFVTYFTTNKGFDEALANAIFDDIDSNNDGTLSVMEYTRWTNKHNKPSRLKKFFDAKSPTDSAPTFIHAASVSMSPSYSRRVTASNVKSKKKQRGHEPQRSLDDADVKVSHFSFVVPTKKKIKKSRSSRLRARGDSDINAMITIRNSEHDVRAKSQTPRKRKTGKIKATASPTSKSLVQLQRNSKDQKIEQLTQENQTLQQEMNELKQQLAALKASKGLLSESEVSSDANSQYAQQCEVLQSTVDDLKFEQLKLNQELVHKDRMYQQKMQSLQSDVAGKEAMNRQLKQQKKNAEQQLKAQTEMTSQIMKELEQTRKKQYARTPRNNDSVSIRVKSTSAGCCSSWWGKKPTTVEVHNMDTKSSATYQSISEINDTEFETEDSEQ